MERFLNTLQQVSSNQDSRTRTESLNNKHKNRLILDKLQSNFISSPGKVDPLTFLEQGKVDIQTKVLHLTSFRLINILIDVAVITMAVKSLTRSFWEYISWSLK